MHYETRVGSPLGELCLASDGSSLTGLWMEGQNYFRGSLKEPGERLEELSVWRQTQEWLKAYFAGDKPSPGQLPLAPAGSDFQVSVWKLLCRIPYGQTLTYGQLAQELGEGRNLARAVGRAVGRNPISIVIPCHRVVGAEGRLTGYAGGLERKARLLELEGLKVDRERFCLVPENRYKKVMW